MSQAQALIGVKHGHFALVPASRAQGAPAMGGQPSLAFEVLIDRFAIAVDALPQEQRMDAPVAITGWTMNQKGVDRFGQLWSAQWPRLTRPFAVIEPTACHAQRVPGQSDGSVELLRQAFYIPSGNRSSLSSQNFFKRSTSVCV